MKDTKNAERCRRYAATPKGKEARARAYERYAATPKGIARRAAASAAQNAKMTPEKREILRQKAAKRRVLAAFLRDFPGGQMSPEFKKYREDHGLPWPVPADEYEKQQARDKALYGIHPSP